MKNSMSRMTATAVAVFLVTGSAFADEVLQAVKGSDLQFSARFTDKVYVTPNTNAGIWNKTRDGERCDSDGVYTGCSVTVSIANILMVNDYKYELPLVRIGFQSLKNKEVLTNNRIERLRQWGVEEFRNGHYSVNVDRRLYSALLSAQKQTIYPVDGGGCYSYEIRFVAETSTKFISRIWPEKIAVRCP